MRTLITAVTALLALPAMAMASEAAPAPNLSLTSSVLVEHAVTDANGVQQTTLAPATTVLPGDTLVFVLGYANPAQQQVNNVVLTNPIPAAVTFRDSLSPTALVSIDSGQSFGLLNTLTVTDTAGQTRPALAADVTHVRWSFDAGVAPGQAGELRFRATVR
jgi:uncharacterized repeat protein (TIGR01451 family)